LAFWPPNVMQTVPLQQPDAQKAGVHGVSHVLLMHCWEFEQTAQAWPPVPQSVAAVPGWHVPEASQQPYGHEEELQVPVSHWPWKQFFPSPAQFMQAPPPLPQ
jgi:hypothetical protein